MQLAAERCGPRILCNSSNCAHCQHGKAFAHKQRARHHATYAAPLFNMGMKLACCPPMLMRTASQPKLMQPTLSAQEVTSLSTSIMQSRLQHRNHQLVQSASKGLW